MRVYLEAVAGPHLGQKILLRDGQSVRVGRTEWADFAFPRDGLMSGVHFALECDFSICRIRDLESTNGLLVNGERIDEGGLDTGDQIQAGETRFAVRIEGATPIVPPAAAAVAAAASAPPAPAEPAAAVPNVDPPAGSATAGGVLRPEAPATPPSVTAPPDAAAPYQSALADDDPTVRGAALTAAAWTRQPWLLAHCRRCCDPPAADNWDAILMLAILGAPEDLQRMLTVGRCKELGPGRFEALGTFGHPGVVGQLLNAIGGADAAAAAAAGEALTKITGVEIDSDRSVELPPDEDGSSDEPTKGPGEEVLVPDLKPAKRHWNQIKRQFADSTRLCRGFDLSDGVPQGAIMQLDMQSRWEAFLRERYAGRFHGKLAEVEMIPFRGGG